MSHSLFVAESTNLPFGYTPCDDDVICGRGAECFNHVGNKRFRQMVDDNLDLYCRSKSRFEKSIIIGQVVDTILSKITIGGFVKKDLITRLYIKLNYFTAREKTSQAFRDANSRKSCKIGRRLSPISLTEQTQYPKARVSSFESFNNCVQPNFPIEISFDDIVEHVCFDLSMLTEMIPLHPLSLTSQAPSQDDSKDKCMEKVLEDLEIFSNENLLQNNFL